MEKYYRDGHQTLYNNFDLTDSFTKKILNIFCFCIICTHSIFASEKDIYYGTKGLEYKFDSKWKVAWVMGRGTARGTNIIIPQMVRYNDEDYKVIQIINTHFTKTLN